MKSLVGTIIHVPIFDTNATILNGSNATYTPIYFAAFYLTGFSLEGHEIYLFGRCQDCAATVAA